MRGTRLTTRTEIIHARFIPAGAGNTSPSRAVHKLDTVHPRGCGEHGVEAASECLVGGSSPRVRGTRSFGYGQPSCSRFIPAGAGNTTSTRQDGSAPAVHPRGCGEHNLYTAGWERTSGSSPRVRGTHRLARRFAWWRPVHPRGCGEHPWPKPLRTSAGGSSPRVRGTRLRGSGVPIRDRFIPAGAGNTCARRTPYRPEPVHPRGCGEHIFRLSPARWMPGSSPRVRGTRHHRQPHRQPRRFIPAGAGNTAVRLVCTASIPVHPRGCGEHTERFLRAVLSGGSSPRVRGTLKSKPADNPQYRFIPAGAGNTHQRPCLSLRDPVHPRGCGEHTGPAGKGRSLIGSSPRVRGTRSDVAADFFP